MAAAQPMARIDICTHDPYNQELALEEVSGDREEGEILPLCSKRSVISGYTKTRSKQLG